MRAPLHHPFRRHRFRWVNGIGFALTAFFTLWLVAFALAHASRGFRDAPSPVPLAYGAVGAVSLLASAVLLGIVLVGYVWRHADLQQTTPRYLLFAWTCAGALFHLSQGLALVRFGRRVFAGVPAWLTDLFWYFVPVGAVAFLLLLWVNSEGHHYPWEPAEDDDEGEVGPAEDPVDGGRPRGTEVTR